MIVTLDLETTIFNKGNPFDTRNFVVSSHIKLEDGGTKCGWFTDADFVGNLKEAVAGASLIVGVNLKFDIHWLVNLGIQLPRNVRIWDSMLAEFILSGQTNSFFGLDELVALYNLGEKDHTIDGYWTQGISTENIPKDIVETRGNTDVDLTYQVYLRQRTDPRMTPELEKLIILSGLDLLVLQEMEHNGFRYNVQGSLERSRLLEDELRAIEEELATHSPIRLNWDSGDQLSCFLYGGSFDEDIYHSEQAVYKSGAKVGDTYTKRSFVRTDTHRFSGFFKPIKGTELAKHTAEKPCYATSEPVLLKLKSRDKLARHIINLLLRRATLSKLIGTYLNAMPELINEMHWADNTIHGQFNQVVARTGRLSSSRPNMQNAPEEVDEFFITRYAS